MRSGPRWQPNQIKRLLHQRDLNTYPVSFVIHGNHEDLNGNAVPYERMTQRSKRQDLRARRYQNWKLHVLSCFSVQTSQGIPCESDGYYRLDVKCFFLGENHADPENVRKGIQDALFVYGDKHVIGSVDLEHVTETPRVEVVVDKILSRGGDQRHE